MTLIANDYYWIYSTLAQSLAALIGITGVFAVFRLQWAEKEIDKAIQTLRNHISIVSDYSHFNFERLTEKELIIEVDKHILDLDKKIEDAEKRKNVWERRQDDNGNPLNNVQLKIAPESIASLTKHIKQNLSTRNELKFLKNNIFSAKKYRNNLASKALWLIALFICIFLLSIIGLIFSKYFENKLVYGLVFLIFIVGLLVEGAVLLFRFCKISFHFGLSEVDVLKMSGKIK